MPSRTPNALMVPVRVSRVSTQPMTKRCVTCGSWEIGPVKQTLTAAPPCPAASVGIRHASAWKVTMVPRAEPNAHFAESTTTRVREILTVVQLLITATARTKSVCARTVIRPDLIILRVSCGRLATLAKEMLTVSTPLQIARVSLHSAHARRDFMYKMTELPVYSGRYLIRLARYIRTAKTLLITAIALTACVCVNQDFIQRQPIRHA